jgi:DNA (cytosine-5)-methyltransferase 1
MLKLLDLFSGIGGFSLGLESTGGFETIAFVEKDDFCQKVLKKHWPNTTIEGDIRNVKGDKYEADIITGGFPCQPFSVAGKRKGVDDDRYLWDETIRVVRECKPRWFIGENVEGLININNGVVLRQVQTDLEKEGFEVQCLVIPASGIGAWHQRKRIWIMAYSNSNGHRNKIQGSNGEKKKIQDQHRQNNSSSWQSSGTSTIWNANSEYVSNSESKRTRKNNEGIWESSGGINGRKTTNVSNSKSISSNDGRYGNDSEKEQIQFKVGRKNSNGDVSNSNDKGLERLNGNSSSFKETKKQTNIRSESSSQSNVSNSNDRFSIGENKEIQTRRNTSSSSSSNGTKETWWQTESRICGVPNGVSFELDKNRNNRIKSLGNSIVPQIVRELGFAILESEK